MGVCERIEWNGIEGLRVGRYGHRVNTTCILWRLGTTLIDSGPPNQWACVRAFAREQSLDQVVATHHHEDHAGNLSKFKHLGHSRLLAPRESLDLIANGFPLQMYRRIVWGRPGRIRAEPFSECIELADGNTLEPILLPGHSPDMTCLLDRTRGVLFGADLYVGGRLRYLRQDENLNGIVAGLRHILTCDFGTLLCSHRGLVRPAKEKLALKLEYLEELREKARSLQRKEVPPETIARHLLGREDFVSYFSFGHFSKRNLIAACLQEDGSVPSS
jgi:glyoxylase-like metal-dependent hydrolase (beta-lactamase superfamily II)